MRCLHHDSYNGFEARSLSWTGLKNILFRPICDSQSAREKAERIFYLRSGANTDPGIFLIFLGTVAVLPLYWLYNYYTLTDVTDWKPALYLSAILIAAGIYCAFLSRESIAVGRSHMRIDTGILKKPIVIRWSEEPALKLALNIDDSKMSYFWELKLIDGRREYSVKRLPLSDCRLRTTGRQIAKLLHCRFIECGNQGGTTIIDSADMEVPFAQRVRKTPDNASGTCEKPEHSRLAISNDESSFHAIWALHTKGLPVGMPFLAMTLFAATCLHWTQGGPSFLEQCAAKGEYLSYCAEGAVLAMISLYLAGIRMHISADRSVISYSETLLGVVLKKRALPLDSLEDIRITTVSGKALIHIFSGEKSIVAAISGGQDAGWLHCRLCRFLGAHSQSEDIR